MLNIKTIKTLESNGFTVKEKMKPLNNEKGIFDGVFSVFCNEKEILYLRQNGNDSFNTIELLKYPSSYQQSMENVTLDKVNEILQSIIAINFKYNVYDLQQDRYLYENVSELTIRGYAFHIVADRAATEDDDLGKEFQKHVNKGIENFSFEVAKEILKDWEYKVEIDNGGI